MLWGKNDIIVAIMNYMIIIVTTIDISAFSKQTVLWVL